VRKETELELEQLGGHASFHVITVFPSFRVFNHVNCTSRGRNFHGNFYSHSTPLTFQYPLP